MSEAFEPPFGYRPELYVFYCYDLLLLEPLCDKPSNVRTVSCGSGNASVSYEGDTCSFTCNTGYELTGSDTRTCQSDGSWSGSDDVCKRGKYDPYCLI